MVETSRGTRRAPGRSDLPGRGFLGRDLAAGPATIAASCPRSATAVCARGLTLPPPGRPRDSPTRSGLSEPEATAPARRTRRRRPGRLLEVPAAVGGEARVVERPVVELGAEVTEPWRCGGCWATSVRAMMSPDRRLGAGPLGDKIWSRSAGERPATTDRVCPEVFGALLRRLAKRAHQSPAVPAVRPAGSGRALSSEPPEELRWRQGNRWGGPVLPDRTTYQPDWGPLVVEDPGVGHFA